MTFGLHLSIVLIFSWHSPSGVSVRLANPWESTIDPSWRNAANENDATLHRFQPQARCAKLGFGFSARFPTHLAFWTQTANRYHCTSDICLNTFLPRRRSKVQFRVHTRPWFHSFLYSRLYAQCLFYKLTTWKRPCVLLSRIRWRSTVCCVS